MSRSRAFNRSNRFNAKRRRRTLRSAVPGLQEEALKFEKQLNHSQDLINKLTQKEALVDLIEPNPVN